MESRNTLTIRFTIADVAQVALDNDFAWDRLSGQEFWGPIERSHAFVSSLIRKNADVYGITTGFGRDNITEIPEGEHVDLQAQLVRFHGCGQGAVLSESQSAAAMFARLACLVQGGSGVSRQLIEQMTAMLRHRVIPVIPRLGSVGASGDLTPLSYVAAAISGERRCYLDGSIVPSSEALRARGLKPYALRDRDALAIMNGTSMMTGLACLAWRSIEQGARLMTDLSALTVEVVQGKAAAFHPALHARKPHPGQVQVSAAIYASLDQAEARLGRQGPSYEVTGARAPIQDVYSVRCTPQALGPLVDLLEWTRGVFETELNSVNDNPVFDHEREMVLHGGHFYGGHVSVACDALKVGLCHAVNLCERQIALLMSGNLHADINHNLVPLRNGTASTHLNHGLKAVHILASAIAAEIVQRSAPASTLSRPTESHNQDVVSMGSIAARSLADVADLAEILVAIHAATVSQACYALEVVGATPRLRSEQQGLLQRIRKQLPPLCRDRDLDGDLETLRKALFS